jgi:ATP-dependent Clp protease protease subunit
MKYNLNYWMSPKKQQNVNPRIHEYEEEKESAPMIASLSQNTHPIFSRAILFDQEINEMTSTALRAEVLAKSAEDPSAPIYLFLGSPGGGLYESLAIYDTFQLISNPIIAICSGKVMSGGILILLGCDIRLSTPNNTFMIHHGHTMLSGNVVQLKEQHNEIESLNDRMLDIIIKKTDISREQLKTWLVKDHYMNPEAALKYGLIHHQISSLDEIIIEKEPIPVDAILDSAVQKPKKKAAKKISKKKVTKKK